MRSSNSAKNDSEHTGGSRWWRSYFHLWGWLICGWLFLLLPAWEAEGRQALHGHVLAITKNLASLGELATTNSLHLGIGLPLRNRSELNDLLQQLYDPASTNYHRFLTPAQFTERFGPSQEDYQAVVAFAQAQGLTVTKTQSNRLMVNVTGSVGTVEAAFHTKLHAYRHPRENRTFYAPDTEPALDLNVPVLEVSGLNNYLTPHPLNVRESAPISASASVSTLAKAQAMPANLGSGPGGNYMGNDFRVAYVPNVSLTGAGQSVALVQFDSGFYQSDITTYESVANLPAVPVQTVLLDGYDGGPGIANDEVSLDIEMAISMAPGLSNVIVYEGINTDDILNQIATDDSANQISASWAYPIDATTLQIYQQFAAQGQSFFNSAGDNDAWAGAVDSPCDNPYITIVGGTSLSMNGNGNSWASETVWNRDNGTGSGGGISIVYTIPSWQTNVSMATNGGSTSMRNLPDVAMAAENVWVYYGNGSGAAFGGTSCASPLWAGLAALMNQEAVAAGQPLVGFLNPALYKIGSGPLSKLAFHDITTGDNTSPASPNQFFAVPGYDLCSGWGTPAGQYLINAIADPEPLLILPGTGFNSVGGTAGPFTVTSQSLVLTNTGTNTLTWSLINPALWLTAFPSGGTLTPGGPATTVIVTLNLLPYIYGVGTNSAPLTFTNWSDHTIQTRQYTLNIINAPTITTQPTNTSVLAGATAVFSVQASGGGTLSYQWRRNGTNLIDNLASSVNATSVSGATSNRLTITGVFSNSIGTYSVVVSNLANTVTSSSATLALVPSRPVIQLQPTNQIVLSGNGAQFSVQAYGTRPFTYQWSLNGTNIPGATGDTFSIASASATNAGVYAVTISNIYGAVTTSNVNLTVLTIPACDAPPAGLVSWWPGEGNALDIMGTNTGVLGPDVAFAPAMVGDGWVLNDTNAYVRIPASSSLNVGTGKGFTLEAWIMPTNVDGLHPIAEWNDGTNSIGVALWIGENPWDEGVLCVTMVDTNNNNYGQVATRSGVLTANVFQHVALTYNQANGYVKIYVNGTNVVSYNWGVFGPQTGYDLWVGLRPETCGCWTDGTFFGGTIDELSLYNRALSTNELAAIYNAGSGGKCAPLVAPYIVTQPANQLAPLAGAATFSVLAGGTGPLGYQWTFNATNLPGATNALLVLTNLQVNQSGTYAVTVSNVFGFTNSSTASLNVYTVPPVPPFITTQPTNQTIFAGQSATFTVSAGGTLPLNCYWYFNEALLSGATNGSLTISNAQAANAGDYVVIITNIYGAATSAVAVLTVTPIAPPDHFTWSPIHSPRFVNSPFSVTLQAQDAQNNCLSNYWGAVSLGNGSGVPLQPSASGNFSNGVWTGTLVISAAVTNVVLQATDGLGHSGQANAITVVNPPTLATQTSGQVLLLYWPVTATNFLLQVSHSLAPGQWTPVTTASLQIGHNNLLPIVISNTNSFYRLIYSGP